MCMLCVVPPGVIPDRDKLINSALNNPHGFGFAIAVPEEQRIIAERSMNADESINRFIEVRSQYMDGYAMWHARFATHGAKNVNNCHPFIVGKDKRTYLAHNGILDVSIDKSDDRSDTRVFAEDVLPAMGGVKALDNDNVFTIIEDWAAGSKIAVLTVDPEAKHPLYHINARLGNEDASGVWWSNETCYLDSSPIYKPKSKTYLAGGYEYYGDYYDGTRQTDNGYVFSKDDEDIIQVTECLACGAMIDEDLLIQYDFICTTCGFCFDCEQLPGNCMCYPARQKRVS